MERRGSFHRYQRNQGSISGSSKLNNSQNPYAAMDNNNNNNNNNNNDCLPYANLLRIMKKVLPNHAKVSDSAKETIQECIAEYINFITSEANDKCKQEHRKTVTSEDILWAMHKLGFDDYIEPLNTYLNRYRELEGDLRGSLKGEPLPTKAAHVGPWASPPAVGPNIGPALQIGQHQAGPSGEGMGAYLGDGSQANPTQQPMGGV